MAFFSTTLTPTTAPQTLMALKPLIRNITQIAVTVQSMGTATYINIGGPDSQDKKFTMVGDGFSISGTEKFPYVDVSTIRVISDTADAVLDIFGDSDT